MLDKNANCLSSYCFQLDFFFFFKLNFKYSDTNDCFFPMFPQQLFALLEWLRRESNNRKQESSFMYFPIPFWNLLEKCINFLIYACWSYQQMQPMTIKFIVKYFVMIRRGQVKSSYFKFVPCTSSQSLCLKLFSGKSSFVLSATLLYQHQC